LRGLQAFAPTGHLNRSENSSLPLEILIDLLCDTKEYERLVPQADATVQYDKFNRLRLHNRLSNMSGTLADSESADDHLRFQTVGLYLHAYN